MTYPIGTKVRYWPEGEYKTTGQWYTKHDGTIIATGRFKSKHPYYKVRWENIPEEQMEFFIEEDITSEGELETTKTTITINIGQDWIKTQDDIVLGAI